MKLYVVSGSKNLRYNSGFITLITNDYDKAFAEAIVGQFIHEISAESVHEVASAGKMLVKVD